MKGRKLIAAALLAGMVSSPVVMAEVLSDKALGEVSAQGFQVASQYRGASLQNANNDAVQLNDDAQRNAAGMAVTNSAASAVNVGQNVAGLVKAKSKAIAQRSNQYADNSEGTRQSVYQNDNDQVFGSTVLRDRQNANNGAVQLNANGQRAISGMAITNAASSAANVGQNVAGAISSKVKAIGQSNIQVAQNAPVVAQKGFQEDTDILHARTKDKDRQNMNNGSVQGNDAAQMRASGLALTNSAASALNVGENVVGLVESKGRAAVAQRNDQYANNDAGLKMGAGQSETNIIRHVKDRDRQNVNNGAVQLNNRAQKNVSGLAITNAASSAANVGQNIVGVSQSKVGNIAQANKEVAVNTASNGQIAEQSDLDRNGRAIRKDVDRQEANNGSVQMNNRAQKAATGLIIGNIASSAANQAQNVAGAVDGSKVGSVAQGNNQYAEDGSYNTQDVAQTHSDTYGIDVNNGKVNTNNGSVQANDQAQRNAAGLIISNAAGSALNVGQNIAGFSSSGLGTLTQTNVQSALNY